jgi:WD40 repeat protein
LIGLSEITLINGTNHEAAVLSTITCQFPNSHRLVSSSFHSPSSRGYLVPVVRKSKTRVTVGALLLLGGTAFVYDQLFVIAEPMEADFIRLHSTFTEHDQSVWTVVFSPNNSLLASSGIDPIVRLWRRSDGEVTQALEHPYGVPALAFSPDGEYVATGCYDGFVRVWRVLDGQLMRTSPQRAGTVWGLTFSPDGQTIASGSINGNVDLWDLPSDETTPLHGHQTGDVWSLTYTPNGSTMATAGHDHLIKIWDTGDKRVIHEIDGHNEAIVSVAFSPDGRTLASGSDDKTVKLWNSRDWSLIATLTAESESVYSVAFSPDGTKLISGSRDKKELGEILQYRFGYAGPSNGVTIRLWDLATGELLQSNSEHAEDVSSVAFSFDGRFAASASEDKTVKLWQVPIQPD